MIMKKIYSFVTCLLVAGAVNAQSQRLVLEEEFTQASCGPCAAANPAFNTLLNNNTSKAISIKYQTSWPGVDPMNAQYPAAVAARVSYYSCTGVPFVAQDGVPVTGASYTGYPGNLTQTKINNEYAVTSPFTIDVSHYLNAAQDSIFISATLTASQAFTAGGYPRLHIVLVEKHIHFTTAPGSNGEKDFYNVARRMYPTQTGTLMPMVWNAGDDTTITIKAAIPSYIYDINQLAVVSFLQDNTDKSVLQAGYSNSPVGVYNYVNMPSDINLFPNPANNNTTFRFTLAQDAEVVVNVYNAVGALVSTENKGTRPAGKQEVSLSLEMLASGIYTVELVADNNRSTRKLNVVH
jgi:hypothetical protein